MRNYTGSTGADAGQPLFHVKHYDSASLAVFHVKQKRLDIAAQPPGSPLAFARYTLVRR